MSPNPQETADLVTFTEEILMENCSVCAVVDKLNSMSVLLYTTKPYFMVHLHDNYTCCPSNRLP